MADLPIFNRAFRVLAFKIVHRTGIDDFLAKEFDSLKPTLRKAQLFMTVEEYVSTAIVSIALLLPIIFLMLRMLIISQYGMGALAGIIISLFFTVVFAGVLFVGFIIYPEYQLDNIKRDLESNLPYATTHMATIAGTGVPIYLVFKIIGDFPEYGELSKECRRISRNIDLFGYDTISALSEAATDTPSNNFKDLLWALVSVIRSGGDMRSLLMEKARVYMDNQKNQENEYLDALELMAELYTTLFVAAPILFVVMATIMGSIGALPIDLDLLFTLFV
jgi:archaellum biogenesis protein FlaJ (TadC family)